ncbi:Ankyrin repeat-containing protein [Cedratvirus Zaza IHUMI]|uniref:Ankyrin repeat-containing protein n=1 Tax=Cedratvirus Zaza IHUMI TaxID=2126979 RepID=A0A2R8FF11_9VIRU|nr:Ankyrin repeat-containing protein [Cedratvirus Zaza IHUMI]
METVYETIFACSGSYNYLNGKVCSQFRQIAPSVHVLVYWNQLLQEAKEVPGLKPTKKIAELALEKRLFHLLKVCKEFIPRDICYRAAKEGDL